jgi:hypothetical protein
VILVPDRPFAVIFPAEAARDERVIASARGLPAGRIVVRERLGTTTADRGKTWLDVAWIEGETVLATFVHDLATGATTLDPDGPQSRFSDPLLASYQASLDADPAWRATLAAHHAAWFAIVDDPPHPPHAAVCGPDAPPAEEVILDPAANPPLLRAQKRVGPNAPCPCGSGAKYKRCHGSQF